MQSAAEMRGVLCMLLAVAAFSLRNARDRGANACMWRPSIHEMPHITPDRGASRKRMQFRCASDTMRAAKAGNYPAG